VSLTVVLCVVLCVRYERRARQPCWCCWNTISSQKVLYSSDFRHLSGHGC